MYHRREGKSVPEKMLEETEEEYRKRYAALFDSVQTKLQKSTDWRRTESKRKKSKNKKLPMSTADV